MPKNNLLFAALVMLMSSMAYSQTDMVYEDGVRTVNDLLRVDNELALKASKEKMLGGPPKPSGAVMPAPIPPMGGLAASLPTGNNFASAFASAKPFVKSIYGTARLFADFQKGDVTHDGFAVGDKFEGCEIAKITATGVFFANKSKCSNMPWSPAKD